MSKEKTSKKEMFNGWILISEGFELEVFSNGNKVVIKAVTLDREEVFDGIIEESYVRIYDMSTYYCSLEIDYGNKIIKIIKDEQEE
ncbi:hypothetical protein [Miniphocaeibacter massiliensis]|uniref:hypothetical protein n=1 Tax=Miniphocaeibacter massiliensis TaxID=2041841 RepID=UPI000C1C07FD|nr:hypothetical protein [Miniphocaeibacter massiliensis]